MGRGLLLPRGSLERQEGRWEPRDGLQIRIFSQGMGRNQELLGPQHTSPPTLSLGWVFWGLWEPIVKRLEF